MICAWRFMQNTIAGLGMITAPTQEMTLTQGQLIAAMVTPKADFFALFSVWLSMLIALFIPLATHTLRLLLKTQVIHRRRISSDAKGFIIGNLVVWFLYAALISVLQYMLIHSQAIDGVIHANALSISASFYIISGLFLLFYSNKNPSLYKELFLNYVNHAYTLSRHAPLVIGMQHAALCLQQQYRLLFIMLIGGLINSLTLLLIAAFILLQKLLLRLHHNAYRFSSLVCGLSLIMLGLYYFFTLL